MVIAIRNDKCNVHVVRARARANVIQKTKKEKETRTKMKRANFINFVAALILSNFSFDGQSRWFSSRDEILSRERIFFDPSSRSENLRGGGAGGGEEFADKTD